mmetsp:Transcript_43955/g.70654  ORF Transcript_43955/g.70654 Transcript_43955/m.70654 type:complete len:265 (-) Transcript_43955:105-899(-)
MSVLRATLLARLSAAPRPRSRAAPQTATPRHASARASSASSMALAAAYPVGTPGQKWEAREREQWRALVEAPSRAYSEEVLAKLEGLKERFDVVKYGSLPYDADPERYPLYAVKTKHWSPDKPSVLITGGVHGYETSGVQGALRFLDTRAAEYAAHFNICVAPCISPWGYERIQRWNAMAVDPNRSFDKNGPPPAEEAAALMALVASLGVDSWLAHIDLHETTDSDESEFRPAKASRDGETSVPDTIPDGFYVVGLERLRTEGL